MVPTPLPKITAPTSAELTQGFTPQPAAAALVKPGQTPAEYIAALEQHHQSTDAINSLAHGMPERDSTWWACQSARKVDGKLAPADKDALGAAENWVKNPSPSTQAQAAAAAAKTNYQGPGAWAAQAAASAQPAAPAAGAAAPAFAAPAAPALTPKAVAGSVQLSSALAANAPMPKPPAVDLTAPPLPGAPLPQPPAPTPPPSPADQAAAAKAHQPFIDLGKDIAAGKNSWA